MQEEKKKKIKEKKLKKIILSFKNIINSKVI